MLITGFLKENAINEAFINHALSDNAGTADLWLVPINDSNEH